jgi:hypothetical protein
METHVVKYDQAGMTAADLPDAPMKISMIAQVIHGNVRLVYPSPRRAGWVVGGDPGYLRNFWRDFLLVGPQHDVVSLRKDPQNLHGIIGDTAATRRER